jgi:hypothetical protein
MSVAPALHFLHDQQSHPRLDALARELILAADAHPSDKVIIAGAEQLDLLISLIRRGFGDVGCLSAGYGPHLRTAGTDVVIAPHVDSEAELLHILQRLGCALRSRGVLVVHETLPGDSCNDRRLRQIFLEAGFAALERVPSSVDTGHNWCAYKRSSAIALAA